MSEWISVEENDIVTLMDDYGNSFDVKIIELFPDDEEGYISWFGYRIDNNEEWNGRMKKLPKTLEKE